MGIWPIIQEDSLVIYYGKLTSSPAYLLSGPRSDEKRFSSPASCV